MARYKETQEYHEAHLRHTFALRAYERMVFTHSRNKKVQRVHKLLPRSKYEIPVFNLIKELISLLPDGNLKTENPTSFWHLLWYGIFNDQEIDMLLPGRNVEPIELRARLVELFVQQPELLKLIANEKIACQHHTGSAALENILTHGLLGRSEQTENMFTPNGFFDSVSNEKHVSLCQWHDLGFQSYFTQFFEEVDHYRTVSPLTHENLDQAIRAFSEKANKWRSTFGEYDTDGSTNMTYSDLQVLALEKMKSTLNKRIEQLKSPLSKEIFIANFPVVFLTQEPDKWVIPHGDIVTEIMAINGLPLEKIKAVIVPEKWVEKVKTLIKENQLHKTQVFAMEKFWRNFFPYKRL